MKKFSKSTTIVLSVIICLVLVIGFIFSFVPMTFGSKTYVSLAKSINISSDLKGGMYGEYDITTENPTKTELVNSMAKIKKVFEDDGYQNVNVYTVGNNKLRVEVSYPAGSKTYAGVYSDLSAISSGKFYLSSKGSSSSSSDTSEPVVVNGNECVKEVKVFTNNDTKYISVIFNSKGEEAYKNLVTKVGSSGSVYIYLGTYNQSISLGGNVTDYSSFTLSDSDYSNLMALAKRITVGCMDIEINSDTAVISTMAAGLSSSAIIIVASVIVALLLIMIAFFAIKFGMFAIVVAISVLFNSYLFLGALNLMPSIEIGFASLVSLVLGTAIIYTYTYLFAKNVKEEYERGKSFSASLEGAIKKTFANSLIGNISLFVMAIIVFAFSFGELTSASIVFAVCAFLSILTNFAIIPFLVKVGISFANIGQKLFMLKKRSIGFVEQSSNEELKEEM